MGNRFPRLAEPGLSFRYGQILTDPHDGLSLFGPYDTDMPSHPQNLTYGVIGTDEGVSAFARFSEALGKAHSSGPNRPTREDSGLSTLVLKRFSTVCGHRPPLPSLR